jgi:hypothetical protein
MKQSRVAMMRFKFWVRSRKMLSTGQQNWTIAQHLCNRHPANAWLLGNNLDSYQNKRLECLAGYLLTLINA